jgi:hypothetical protein
MREREREEWLLPIYMITDTIMIVAYHGEIIGNNNVDRITRILLLLWLWTLESCFHKTFSSAAMKYVSCDEYISCHSPLSSRRYITDEELVTIGSKLGRTKWFGQYICLQVSGPAKCSSRRAPLATRSMTKWMSISICFVWWWKTIFLAIIIALILS